MARTSPGYSLNQAVDRMWGTESRQVLDNAYAKAKKALKALHDELAKEMAAGRKGK